MKIGDLIKWESVKNDIEREFDTDFGIILEFKKDYEHKALIQFYDEIVWLSVRSIQVINEQQQEVI